MSFRLTLSTPDRTFYEGQADSVVAPGAAGSFGVLERHANMISALDTGILVVKDAEGEKRFVIDGGVTEITPTGMAVFADEVRPARDAADAEEKLEELIASRQTRV